MVGNLRRIMIGRDFVFAETVGWWTLNNENRKSANTSAFQKLEPRSDPYQSQYFHDLPLKNDYFGQFKWIHGAKVHSIMALPRSRRLVLEGSEFKRVVKDVLDEEIFCMNYFWSKNSNVHAKMSWNRSNTKKLCPCYENPVYRAVCMTRSSLTTNICSTRKRLFAMNPIRGGTNKFRQHLLTHRKRIRQIKCFKVWI